MIRYSILVSMLESIKKISKNEFVRGGMLVTLSFTASNIFNLFYTIFAGRRLGPAGYGEITALLSYISIASVPMAVIITVITQKVSAADENATAVSRVIERFFWKTIKRWWFVIALPLVCIPFISSITNLTPLTSQFLLPIVWATFLLLFYSSFLQGIRLFLIYSIITVMSPAIKLLGPMVSPYLGQELFVILMFLFLSFFIPFIVAYRSYASTLRKNNINPAPIERSLGNIIFEKQFLITTASILGITLLNNFDVIFVKKYFSGAEAGIYGSWSLMAKMIFYTIGPITTVSFVFFSSKKQSDNHNKTLISSLILFSLIGIMSYFFYTMFAQLIIGALFGHSFITVLPYLGLASIFGTLYSLITFLNNYFMARKSIGALILPLMSVVYICMFFFIGKTLRNVMLVDIYFALGVLLIYLIFYLINVGYKRS